MNDYQILLEMIDALEDEYRPLKYRYPGQREEAAKIAREELIAFVLGTWGYKEVETEKA